MLARLRVLQFDFLEFLIAGHSSNLGAIKNLDVLLCLHATRQVIGHFAGDIVADVAPFLAKVPSKAAVALVHAVGVVPVVIAVLLASCGDVGDIAPSHCRVASFRTPPSTTAKIS